MASPITTPNSRHLINKMCFEGCLVREMPASWGSVPERLECSSNKTSLEAVI